MTQADRSEVAPPAGRGVVGALRRADCWRRSRHGRRVVRYVSTSCLCVVVGQLTLAVAFGAFGWTARAANYLAFVVAGVPSYTLSRRWTWGRTGRSHLLREVVPFWAIAAVGLVASTAAVSVADTYGRAVTDSRALRTAVLMVASFVAFGGVWIGKFVVLNRVFVGGPVRRL